jgi:hypothetical protein
MHSNSHILTFLMKPVLKFHVPEIQCSLVDVWISFQACIQITQLIFVCKVIYSTTWNKISLPSGRAFQPSCIHFAQNNSGEERFGCYIYIHNGFNVTFEHCMWNPYSNIFVS